MFWDEDPDKKFSLMGNSNFDSRFSFDKEPSSLPLPQDEQMKAEGITAVRDQSLEAKPDQKSNMLEKIMGSFKGKSGAATDKDSAEKAAKAEAARQKDIADMMAPAFKDDYKRPEFETAQMDFGDLHPQAKMAALQNIRKRGKA